MDEMSEKKLIFDIFKGSFQEIVKILLATLFRLELVNEIIFRMGEIVTDALSTKNICENWYKVTVMMSH
jgi:hypothetical protein